MYRISRRGMLIGSGALAALGLGVGAAGGFATGRSYGIAKAPVQPDIMQISYPLRGKYQPGILTPQPQQMHTAAYTVTTDRKESLIRLLKEWTLAAERMMHGDLIRPYKTFKDVPPDDTGETGDLGPAALTVTFGFGRTLFLTDDGKDRFGIANRMPEPLKAGIPRMAAEKLDPEACDGDIIIQVCAEDPMVALHAIHNLTRIGFGTASLKWSQLGYGRTSSTSTAQKTPRNLFGFKDGTSNIKAEDGDAQLNQHLWIQPGDSGGDWAANGSYLCVRKIKQFMEVWDELILSEQEAIIGRDKITGAPLSGGDEFTAPDFEKKGPDGQPLIPEDSHVAVVHPTHNNGARMLRRGYNYMEGNDKLGRLEGGLFFIAYVRDPQTNFVPVLRRMVGDAMTEYLQHIASGLYIMPPGLGQGQEYVGQSLLG
ncbi:peroxidase [Boudabousia liubingyangii]|uniref:Peroxidase n=2 Tax=Boudabousia liubingyangii TaxID=1921764 RepID=A0A1Q5PLX2_9ACTO|nr:peroxidase [Boudabousia liubingyangii]OKL48036.1 peroxidase [Boudabousia liubingyangii]